MKRVGAALSLLLSLFYTQAGLCSITTYNLDKNTVCNNIFNSPNFKDFLALQEFFRVYPQYVSSFNPADPHYCFDLKIAYTFFYKNIYTQEDITQFYNNCLNFSDQEVAFTNESFLRVQSAIINCHLN
ncbi:MAG: hypothetical protein JSR17_06325 [Proteobacteria bacterium]|nr:hypothetical protein [Pseudomonadota bacterium]